MKTLNCIFTIAAMVVAMCFNPNPAFAGWGCQSDPATSYEDDVDTDTGSDDCSEPVEDLSLDQLKERQDEFSTEIALLREECDTGCDAETLARIEALEAKVARGYSQFERDVFSFDKRRYALRLAEVLKQHDASDLSEIDPEALTALEAAEVRALIVLAKRLKELEAILDGWEDLQRDIDVLSDVVVEMRETDRRHAERLALHDREIGALQAKDAQQDAETRRLKSDVADLESRLGQGFCLGIQAGGFAYGNRFTPDAQAGFPQTFRGLQAGVSVGASAGWCTAKYELSVLGAAVFDFPDASIGGYGGLRGLANLNETFAVGAQVLVGVQDRQRQHGAKLAQDVIATVEPLAAFRLIGQDNDFGLRLLASVPLGIRATSVQRPAPGTFRQFVGGVRVGLEFQFRHRTGK